MRPEKFLLDQTAENVADSDMAFLDVRRCLAGHGDRDVRFFGALPSVAAGIGFGQSGAAQLQAAVGLGAQRPLSRSAAQPAGAQAAAMERASSA